MTQVCPVEKKQPTEQKILNVMCSPGTCLGAAGEGCFPRTDETGGKDNKESPDRDFSAPPYLNKRSRPSPTTATRVNQQSKTVVPK